jgi:hypothetical protein
LAVLQFSEILPGRGTYKLNKNGKKADTKEMKEDDSVKNFLRAEDVRIPDNSPRGTNYKASGEWFQF